VPVSVTACPATETSQLQLVPEVVQVVVVAPASSLIAPPRSIWSSSQVTVTPATVRQLIGTVTVSDADSLNEYVYVMSELNVAVPLAEI
jgi:hypothetical protein